MKPTLLVLVSFVSVIAALPTAWAGSDLGNGGGGFVCPDKSDPTKVEDVELGDFVRGKSELGLEINRHDDLSTEFLVKRAFVRLAPYVSREVLEAIRQTYLDLLETLKDPKSYLEGDWILPDLGEPKPWMENIRCPHRYIVDYRKSDHVRVVRKFFEGTKSTSRSGLLVHESIYKVARDFGDTDSETSQFMTAYLFAETEDAFAISGLAKVMFTQWHPQYAALEGCAGDKTIDRIGEAVQECSRRVAEYAKLPEPLRKYISAQNSDLALGIDISSLLKGCGTQGTPEQRVADCQERIRDLPAIPDWFPSGFLFTGEKKDNPLLYENCGIQFGSSLERREADCTEKRLFYKGLPKVHRSYFRSPDPTNWNEGRGLKNIITIMPVLGRIRVLWRDDQGAFWTYSVHPYDPSSGLRGTFYSYEEAASECARNSKVFHLESRSFDVPKASNLDPYVGTRGSFAPDVIDYYWHSLTWTKDREVIDFKPPIDT